jgi:hypothetical protein
MVKKKPPSKLPKKLPYKGWRLEHGVSQSLLQKFVICKDRYHKKAVLGLKPTDRKEAMEYGTIFHKLIEEGAKMQKYSRLIMTQIMNEYMQSKKLNSPESLLLCKIAIEQYDKYKQWEANKPKYHYIAQEPVFAEPFVVPATRFNPCPEISINIPRIEVLLRGRIDEVIEINGELWLQENKTKSRIDLAVLQDTIPENIQVMFYAVAASIKYGRPVKGVIYNVIRKPGQRQRQKESDADFLKRIASEIEDQPSYYFYRLAYQFTPGAIEKWEREELIPLLYSLYIWWKSIEKNPTKPWMDEEGNVNPFHGRRSFGIYDPMSNGKGEYFDLLIYGRMDGLIVDHEMFTELKDEEPSD